MIAPTCRSGHQLVPDINFQLAEDDTTRTAEAYGKNYERLKSVKAKYDPNNLFRVNRNIPPGA